MALQGSCLSAGQHKLGWVKSPFSAGMLCKCAIKAVSLVFQAFTTAAVYLGAIDAGATEVLQTLHQVQSEHGDSRCMSPCMDHSAAA
jgi:hypothetical protein